ncbi:MAG: hypothetical protein R3E76_00730 [Planctomycetota bacterium]
MSNKKYRTSPHQTGRKDGDLVTFANDDGIVPETGEEWTAPELSEAEARRMLTRAARFLEGVIDTVARVQSTVDLEAMRKVIAEGMPVPDGIGWPKTEQPKTEQSKTETPQSSNHRKRPRGRMHPLLFMMSLGVKAARQLAQLMRLISPHITENLDSIRSMQASMRRAEQAARGEYTMNC